MRRLSVVPALLTTAVLIAGCGGDDDDDTALSVSTSAPVTAAQQPAATTTTETAGVTKASYIEQADKICQKSEETAKKDEAEIEKITKEKEGDAEILDALAPVFRRAYERQRGQVREFLAIQPPEEDREIVEKYQDALTDQQAMFGRLTDAAEKGDADRFSTLSDEFDDVRTRGRGIAQGYGFKNCGQDDE